MPQTDKQLNFEQEFKKTTPYFYMNNFLYV